MALAISVFITWLVIIILSLIPKKLSELDMVFLYFVNTIFELSIFTIVHLNLRWIDVSDSVEKSFADLVLRIIMNPLLIIISSNVLLYSWKIAKWVIVGGMILSFIFLQKLFEWLGIVTLHHWNIFYTLVMFACYVAFSRFMAWWIVRADPKEVNVK
ncbi:hypothetical protein LSG31_20545 [Fodinisporobacter ferrooxydans]|uniref:Uncharacterized protein n=1 Tax=Fodinisporobacter ferrooxydans TaxID=2901836 RepID=A0ABY4CIM4_9BACL|nr:hypothetical protein LSG31_20545 [Alicyclobacillaceae bacterium MYW30-H2]